MSNMCSFLHKLYIFKIVDAFGIFGPQLVIGLICLALICFLRKPFVDLSGVKIEAWFIGNKALN